MWWIQSGGGGVGGGRSISWDDPLLTDSGGGGVGGGCSISWDDPLLTDSSIFSTDTKDGNIKWELQSFS